MTVEFWKPSAAIARRFALLAGSAVAASAVAVPIASAQGLEDIVVTARHREENVRNIPVAVTAISAETLQNMRINSIESVAQSTPDLFVARGSTGSGATISVRGVGSNLSSAGIEQSVAINIDGIYRGQGRSLNEGIFDVHQVELLKGPQALFFGKNATSGVLAFSSNGPTDELKWMAKAGYEFETETTSVEGYLSGPLTDTLGARFAFRSSNMAGGYVDNVISDGLSFATVDIATGNAVTHAVPSPVREVPGEQQDLARLTLAWSPTSSFDATLRATYNLFKNNDAQSAFIWYNCPFGTPQTSPGDTNVCRRDWVVEHSQIPADIAATNPVLNARGGRGYLRYKSDAVVLDLKYSGDSFSISSLSGWNQYDNSYAMDGDAGAAFGIISGESSKFTGYSSELRFQSEFGSPINFMLGAYYQHTQFDYLVDATIAPLSNSALAGTDLARFEYMSLQRFSATRGETLSAFGQLMWDITDTVNLTGGLRYTHETKDSYYRQPYIIAPLRSAFIQYDPSDPTTQVLADQTFNNTSPEVALTWQPTNNLTIYLAYKEGFKSGGFSNSTLLTASTLPSDITFEPETVAGWEGGVKASLFDNTVRVDLSVYNYLVKDFQVDAFDSSNTKYTTFNAGSVRSRGVEFSAEWAPRPVPGLVLHGTLNYNDAFYNSFPFAQCFAGQTPAEGCNIGLTDSGAVRPFQDLTGDHTALAPKWVASLNANYEREISRNLKLGLTGHMRYSDSYLLSGMGDLKYREPSYALFDASVRISNPSDTWELALIGRNLTNKFALNYASDAPSTGSGTGTVGGVSADAIGSPIHPRALTLQITLRN